MFRKGMALVTVLCMSTILSMICLMLWETVSLDFKIVTNAYRINQAKLAAQSGLNHFMVLNTDVSEEDRRTVIPETRLTSRTSYTVSIHESQHDLITVVSKGIYRKGQKIVFQYPIWAVVKRR